MILWQWAVGGFLAGLLISAAVIWWVESHPWLRRPRNYDVTVSCGCGTHNGGTWRMCPEHASTTKGRKPS